MLDIRLIFKFLMSRKVASSLLIFQIALTCAIIANLTLIAVMLINNISKPHGMVLDGAAGIEAVTIRKNDTQSVNTKDIISRELSILRRVNGVEDIAVVSNIPLSDAADVGVFKSQSDKYGEIISRGYIYRVDENAVPAFGFNIVEGRNFTQSEVLNGFSTSKIVPILITFEFAKSLFPEGGALGGVVELWPGQDGRVVGIVEAILGASASWEGFGRVALFPGLGEGDDPKYVVRSSTSVDTLLADIGAALKDMPQERAVISIKALEGYLSSQYRDHHILLVVLLGIVIILSIFVAYGNYALTSFNVSKQIKNIGIIRALGATKPDILGYYILENTVVTVVGLIFGLALALVLNALLVTVLSMPRMEIGYIPLIIIFYIGITVLATYLPARKASRISPVSAIKSIV